MLDQICEKIEYLRLNNNRRRSATQLAAIYVQNMIFEQIEQVSAPRPDQTGLTATPSRPPAEENKGNPKDRQRVS